MSIFRKAWDKIGANDERGTVRLLLVLFAMMVLMSLWDVLSAWSRNYTIELEATSIQHQDAKRKLDFAIEHDRLLLAKERRDLGLDAGTNTQPLKELGEIFLRVGPYALLFFSISQAWKVIEDQRSSRLRLGLAISFSVVVVGFVLIVGGYVTPTTLNIGMGENLVAVSSESLGIIVVIVGAAMFLASLVMLQPTKSNKEIDEL